MDLHKQAAVGNATTTPEGPFADSVTESQTDTAIERKSSRWKPGAFFFLMVTLLYSGVAKAQTNPFDLLDLGTFDAGELVEVMEDPLSVSALDTIQVILPLDLSGSDPVLLLLIDPDGSAGPDDPFVVPIRLGDLLVDPGDGGPLTAIIDETDQIIDLNDVQLIPGLETLLDTLLGGLSGILGGDDLLSLLDITGSLVTGTVEAVAIEVPELINYTLNLIPPPETGGPFTVEAVPNDFQPDLRVGSSSNAGSHKGNNLYSSGAGQIVNAKSKKGKAGVFFVSFENDGNVSDTLSANSKTSRRKFIRSKVTDISGGGNVTAALKSGSYSRTLSKGQLVTLRFVDKLNKKGKQRFGKGSSSQLSQQRQVNLHSAGDSGKFDAAKAKNKFRN